MAEFVQVLYWYCTDFCLNAANLLGISYPEFNFYLFLVLMPGFLLVLVVLNAYKYLFKPLLRRAKA